MAKRRARPVDQELAAVRLRFGSLAVGLGAIVSGRSESGGEVWLVAEEKEKAGWKAMVRCGDPHRGL